MTTKELLLATFDGNDDGVLSKRELTQRPDLFTAADVDRSTLIEGDEIERVVALVLARGLEMLADDFLGRWDLDGDGEVERSELPPVAWTLLLNR